MLDGTSSTAHRPDPAAAMPSPDERAADSAVEAASRAAQGVAGDLAGAPAGRLDGALRAIAARLDDARLR